MCVSLITALDAMLCCRLRSSVPVVQGCVQKTVWGLQTEDQSMLFIIVFILVHYYFLGVLCVHEGVCKKS